MKKQGILAALSVALTLSAMVGCGGSQQERDIPACRGWNRTRSNGASYRGARLSAGHRTRRAQRQGAAEVRGESAAGRAERHRLSDRRHRVRSREYVRRADSHADARSSRQPGTQVQPLPHDGALLADARGAADRPQPPYEQRRRDHGSGYGVPGQYGGTAAKRHAAGRDPAPERL